MTEKKSEKASGAPAAASDKQMADDFDRRALEYVAWRRGTHLRAFQSSPGGDWLVYFGASDAGYLAAGPCLDDALARALDKAEEDPANTEWLREFGRAWHRSWAAAAEETSAASAPTAPPSPVDPERK